MSKPISVWALAALAALALAACGSSSNSDSNSTSTPAAAPTTTGASGGGSKGGGSTLQLAADPSALKYDTTSLSAKAGKVTIDFDNPSAIGHDVSIDGPSGDIGKTAVITQSKASLTVDLKPGSYTFYCSVDGHKDAGMQGTLTVK
ncbi:MAG: hypothetical protein QOJ38_740 [Solirubrobacterales bacterium]|jgi:plastocyanin|nr:hypothetical protein [Solirubrobacterales bacterium]